jgi:hypothetical protein
MRSLTSTSREGKQVVGIGQGYRLMNAIKTTEESWPTVRWCMRRD